MSDEQHAVKLQQNANLKKLLYKLEKKELIIQQIQIFRNPCCDCP